MLSMSNDLDDDLPTNTKSPRNHSRASLGKRSRCYSYDNSSDGPYFSSDDISEACVDNYVTPRIKRQYRRTWWESDSTAYHAPEKYARCDASKAKDSGVFMASDGSSSSNEDGFGLNQLSARNLKRHGKKFPNQNDSEARLIPNPSRKVDAIAYQIIQACLEADKEDVDLSKCSLTSLSNQTIRPLRDLIRRPRKYQSHHGEEGFQSLNPNLKLFLSSNLLRQLPGEIMNLEHLTVLSIRNNKLTELPHSFGRLRNLVELNVAGNRLTWLPWEILSLIQIGKLQNLHIFPNRFCLPYSIDSTPSLSNSNQAAPNALNDFINATEARVKSSTVSLETSSERLAWLSVEDRGLSSIMASNQRRNGDIVNSSRWTEDGSTRYDSRDVWKSHPIYLGSTPTYLCGLNGPIDSSTGHRARTGPEPQRVLLSTALDCTIQSDSTSETLSSSQVQSLFELALKTCSQHLNFAYLDQDLPQYTPEHILRHLESARNASESGMTTCSVCLQKYIIPRAEWLEYWHCVGEAFQIREDELWVPFLRRTCSWGCVSRTMSERKTRAIQDEKSIDLISKKVIEMKGSLYNNVN